MVVQKNEIYDLLKRLESIFDNSFSLLPGALIVIKPKEVEPIMDSIYGALPQEIQDARRLLRRKEEVISEAQQKAEKIIIDAQNEAARLLSESELLRKVQSEAELIKEQVISECEEIKRKALEDAENFRNQAHDNAMKTKEGAEGFAEQVLISLENTLAQHLQLVKNGQIYLEKLRADENVNYDPLRQNYPQDESSVGNDDFKIN